MGNLSEKTKCLECGSFFNKRRGLHSHLKSHSMSQDQYYHKHFPRRDLYTGEILSYKDYEDYFEKYFEKKGNFSKFIKERLRKESQDLLLKILAHRVETKNLLWEMSEVELVSLQWPSKKQILSVFDNIKDFSIGLNSRYSLETPIINKRNLCIYIDTKEQKPFELAKFEKKISGLNCGDYAGLLDGKESSICIERKSSMDFIGSFGPSNLERLRAEFKRAEVLDKKMIVLVEKDLQALLHFDYMPRTSKWVSVTPEHIFFNIRSVIQEFLNVQFLFVKSKKEAEKLTPALLSNEELFNYDLQYLYNNNKLNVV